MYSSCPVPKFTPKMLCVLYVKLMNCCGGPNFHLNYTHVLVELPYLPTGHASLYFRWSHSHPNRNSTLHVIHSWCVLPPPFFLRIHHYYTNLPRKSACISTKKLLCYQSAAANFHRVLYAADCHRLQLASCCV